MQSAQPTGPGVIRYKMKSETIPLRNSTTERPSVSDSEAHEVRDYGQALAQWGAVEKQREEREVDDERRREGRAVRDAARPIGSGYSSDSSDSNYGVRGGVYGEASELDRAGR